MNYPVNKKSHLCLSFSMIHVKSGFIGCRKEDEIKTANLAQTNVRKFLAFHEFALETYSSTAH